MKHCIILALLCFVTINLKSQAIYEEFNSEILGQSRKIKIQLPRNFDPNSPRTYPLLVVLDGDYLFEPVVGNVDILSYWEDIPDCVVVGIKQAETRNDDFYYDNDTHLPLHDGANFYEFLAQEIIPYMESKYKASHFRVAIGHNLGANFINYFLFKDQPLFRGYMVFSPDFETEMEYMLTQRLPLLKEDTYYYLATADADISSLQKSIRECHSKLSTIKNPRLNYKFDDFEDANHYSLVGRGIPRAINQIFGQYKPITSKEYKKQILPFEGSPFEYLTQKYDAISTFYGFEKELIENDIRAIAAACNKKEDLTGLGKLAKLVTKKFPRSMMSAYYMGMYFEKDGNLKKALLQYKIGLGLQPSQFIDKDIMLEKMYDTQDALND